MNSNDIVKDILDKNLPEWRHQSCQCSAGFAMQNLPPDLLCICVGYIVREIKEYHKNGTLGTHGFYVNEKRHGEWRWWYSSGKLSCRNVFDNGVLVYPKIKKLKF